MENKNNSEKMSKFFDKASEIGRKAADGVQKGAKVVFEKSKDIHHELKVKKYNPLFPEDLKNKDFHIPNIIAIADEASRRSVDVCDGAIGWRSMEDDVEVLHIYDENIDALGVQFIPVPRCDNVYCVDPYDRSRFIKSDYIFGKATEEKVAELEHIAYMLGAKSCSVEIMEATADQQSTEIKANIKAKNNSANAQYSASIGKSNSQSGKTVAYFEGSNTPKIPNLKWFSHDDNINNLIKMRCTCDNSIKSKILELRGSSSATMSVKTACAIDCLLKVKGSVSMREQATKEQSSKLIFEVDF